MRFPVIYADCPWHFKNYSVKGEDRNAVKHYDCMTLKQIQALPIKSIAADDCALLMWCTGPLLDQQIETMKLWGFEYKTIGFSWMKECKNGSIKMGNGYTTRSNIELCLLGTIGSPKRTSAAVKQAFLSIPERHSQKPAEFYTRIEKLYGGPYVELFARKADRPGWTQIGNEITGNSIETDILAMADQQFLSDLL
jgi:N6-adenosine-specific RNA methylase IME4